MELFDFQEIKGKSGEREKAADWPTSPSRRIADPKSGY